MISLTCVAVDLAARRRAATFPVVSPKPDTTMSLRATRTRILSPLMVLCATACASAAPFSVTSPGLETMRQEEPHFFVPPSDAMDALAATSLRSRIDNTVAVYESELSRARSAQGGLLNATLNVLGLLLPISGTASAIALSDPDQAQTVGLVAGAATTAVLGLNLLLKPGAKAESARQCQEFLEGAIESYHLRWGAEGESVSGTEQEWSTYLTMRATLEPGRRSACGD